MVGDSGFEPQAFSFTPRGSAVRVCHRPPYISKFSGFSTLTKKFRCNSDVISQTIILKFDLQKNLFFTLLQILSIFKRKLIRFLPEIVNPISKKSCLSAAQKSPI